MPASRTTWQLCRRLAEMDADELRVRARQAVSKHWDLLKYRMGWRFGQEVAVDSSAGTAKFFFESGEVPAILDYLRQRLPSIQDEFTERAEKICRHEFDLLGYEGVKYERKLDWHFDAVHGKRAPLRPWFRVPYLDFRRVGDHKVIWELNRHQHLVVLAIAYRLTHNRRYCRELFGQWYDWQAHNPYPLGINWASSLEVAIRSLSWLWVWRLLEGCEDMPCGFAFHLRRALAVNARHIEQYLSTHFSPNTHLLGEGAGLFFIGTLCPGARSALRWQDLGLKIVLGEAGRQVRPDGMHFEQSTYYHTYALDFFLHVRILAARNGIPVPAEFDKTLLRMLEALSALSATGPLPSTGDDDGGRVFDPRRNRREHMLDPHPTGTAFFGCEDLKTPSCSVHQEMIWLLGPELVRRFDEMSASQPEPKSIALKSSGLFVMAGGSQRLVIDAGPQGGARAVHGHADALSIQLAADGKDVLIDPGTFVYADAANTRNQFRESRGHNTVVIDGKSQAEPDGLFLWTRLADANADLWLTGKSFDLFSGVHYGYTRLADPVLHRRTVFYLKPCCWLIRDVLEGAGTHFAELCWHFAPGSLTCIPGGIWFEGKSQAAATLLIAADQECKPRISSGWYSPCYGRKESVPIFRIGAKVRLPAEFATLVITKPRALARIDKMRAFPLENKTGHVQGYRFYLEDRVHHVFFADGAAQWQAGACASDARFVHYALSTSGEVLRYCLYEASYLEIQGRRIFSADSIVAQKAWKAADVMQSLSRAGNGESSVHRAA